MLSELPGHALELARAAAHIMPVVLDLWILK